MVMLNPLTLTSLLARVASTSPLFIAIITLVSMVMLVAVTLPDMLGQKSPDILMSTSALKSGMVTNMCRPPSIGARSIEGEP